MTLFDKKRLTCHALLAVFVSNLIFLSSGCSILFWREPAKPVITPGVSQDIVKGYVDRAEELIGAGDLKGAESVYREAIDRYPGSAELHARLAGVYVALEEVDKAIEQFRKSLDIDPTDTANRNYIGYLYEQRGLYSKAASEYELTLERDPKNLYALVHLGLAYRQLGELDKAEVILNTAAVIDPNCESVESRNLYNYLGLVSQDRGDYSKAEEYFKKSISLFPDDVWAHNQLGSLYEEQGKLYEAQTEYLEALRHEPNNAFALSRLAELQKKVVAGRINVEPVEIIEEDVDELIANSPSREEYPESDAVVLLNKFSQMIDMNGHPRFTMHQLIKILTWQGARRYGQVAIPFNQRYQNIGVNVAVTHLPDGGSIEPADDAFTDVTPPGMTESGMFSDMMWKVISMPGVVEGAVIEYKATIEDVRGYTVGDNIWFWGGMGFQGEDPILESKYVLKVPADQEVQWRAYNCELSPEVSDGDGYRTYIWRYGASPKLVVEPGMPNPAELIPRFSFSSVGSWDDVASWYNSMLEDRLMQSPAVEQMVRDLTAGLESLDEQMKAIYDFVSVEIRYVALELGEGTYQPHSAAEVLENRYGDCKDKVVLLKSMLGYLGVEAYPVMISPKPFEKTDRSLPSLGGFSHLIAAIPRERGGYLWLDPTAESCIWGDIPFADQGRDGFIIKSDGSWEFVTLPILPHERNRLTLNYEFTMDERGGLTGEENISATGQHGMIHRATYRYLPHHMVRDVHLFDLATRYPGARLTDIRFSDPHVMTDPFEVSVSFHVDRYASGSDERMSFPLPRYGFLSLAASVAKEGRRFPLNMDFPSSYEKTVVVHLPDGYTAVDLPPDLEITNDEGRLARTIAIQPNQVIYRLTFDQFSGTITTDRYEMIKELVEEFAREELVSIVIEREEK